MLVDSEVVSARHARIEGVVEDTTPGLLKAMGISEGQGMVLLHHRPELHEWYLCQPRKA